jgi:xanthine dehydrogenase small subunit
VIQFILNNKTIETDLPQGTTVLDFVRYHQHLTGTKIGCREGDCGACTVLVGEIDSQHPSEAGGTEGVVYRSMTSCLLPLANVQNKHVVTVEGINQNAGLTPVQKFMVEESGTQCGFCTVGFVMSMTGFALQKDHPTEGSAIAAIDGNICRCTGYKSIERAANRLTQFLNQKEKQGTELAYAIDNQIVPSYFSEIKQRLLAIEKPEYYDIESNNFVGGGTDLYVQKHDEMPHIVSKPLFDNKILRGVKLENGHYKIGASATVSDLKASSAMNGDFPFLQKHLKLVSSTPIRNMATIAGNLVNASPIGDMTVFLLALNATITLKNRVGVEREIALKDFYKGYKTLDKTPDEILTTIRFPQPKGDYHFNFEKVSKRTHLDIASVNSAIFLKTEKNLIVEAHVSVGGVAPIPKYLTNTSAFLLGKNAADTEGWFSEANDIMQSEISPISDVRGSADYKRLLARQLLKAHFIELFSINSPL